jgi:hypothetical protein
MDGTYPFNEGFAGSQDGQSDTSEFNVISFIVQQILGRANTATLVQVVAVTNAGGVSPVGFVDVHPLVNQITGAGAPQPHGTIYHIPYFRLQGGANAIILDPQVGDRGVAVFADHDISVVKATGAQANPGSRRRFDMADGMYLGGFLNGTPTQYIEWSTAGITITSPIAVTINAPTAIVNAPTTTVNATDVLIHCSHSYAQDVNGYGSRLTWTGSNNYQLDTYYTGAVVNSTEHGWSPPEIP